MESIMVDPRISYITKSQMISLTGEDYFGYADWAKGVAYVRSDLPKCVVESVTAHEQWHLDHKSGFEPGAWLAGLKASPSGFFLGILMSLTPSRIWLYIRRTLKGF